MSVPFENKTIVGIDLLVDKSKGFIHEKSRVLVCPFGETSYEPEVLTQLEATYQKARIHVVKQNPASLLSIISLFHILPKAFIEQPPFEAPLTLPSTIRSYGVANVPTVGPFDCALLLSNPNEFTARGYNFRALPYVSSLLKLAQVQILSYNFRT